MKHYCVIKNTIKIIDGSENPTKIMLKNAQNAGFAEDEIEILTEEEYKLRLENEPRPPQEPTDKERLEALEQAMLDMALGGM